MKNKKFTIEEEIQRTLACIDKIDRVSVNPWLPTRLKEKLKAKPKQQNRKGVLGSSFMNGFLIKMEYPPKC